LRPLKTIKNTVVSATVATFLAACGGGGGTGDSSIQTAAALNPASTMITGQFIDGPVKGVDYECSSGEKGITTDNGEFTCPRGDIVKFSIGEIILGEAPVASKITPLSLYPDDPEAAVNVAQLLQTLDDDGDLNVFVIDRKKVKKITSYLDVSSPSFDEEVETVIGKRLVDEESAIRHMKERSGIEIDEVASEKTVDDAVKIDDESVVNMLENEKIIKEENEQETEKIFPQKYEEQNDFSNTDTMEKAPSPSSSLNDLDHKEHTESIGLGTESKADEYNGRTKEDLSDSINVDDLDMDNVDKKHPAVNDNGAEVADNIEDKQSEDDGNGVTEDVATENRDAISKPVCKHGLANIEGRIVAYRRGSPAIANAKIEIGGCLTTTDENGWYSLKNIAENERAVVTITAKGYYKNSRIIYLKQNVNGTDVPSPNYLAFPLDAYDAHLSYDSQVDKDILIEKDARIVLPAGIYMDSKGDEYTGMVEADLAYEDIFTSKGRFEFLGAYEGIDANGDKKLFTSYGMLIVDLKDGKGDSLQITGEITVFFPTISQIDAETIPLWYYDYDKGIWIEEGYATRQSDGSYRGEISHVGAWSLNMPVETASGIYKGKIMYEDGSPARGIRIQARGENWISTDLTTDEEGRFEIEVVPNSDFKIRAYDYVEKFEAVFKDTISGIASGDTFIDNR